MKFFEIGLLLYDMAEDKPQNIRQYFRQETYMQAVFDAMAFVGYEVRSREENKFSVEHIIMYEWQIDMPLSTGEIGSKKLNTKVFEWCYERGVMTLHPSLSNRQSKKLVRRAKHLFLYRPSKSLVSIEEIGNDLMDGVSQVSFTNSAVEGDMESLHRHF